MSDPMMPPIAAVRPAQIAIHGDLISDPYAWLEQREDPAVIAHLEAENAYTAATLAPTAELAAQIYREMRGRIKEDDSSVPVPIGPYQYYFRSETGEEHPRYCRRRGHDGPEELLLNGNLLAEGQSFFRFGRLEPSPDQTKLAYTIDTTGAWVYTLYVLDLATGSLIGSAVPDVGYDIAWANDSRTILYTIFDQAHRPYQLHRRTIDADSATLVYHEADEAFSLSLDKTRSQAYLLLTSHSYTASEVRYAPADDPSAPFVVFAPRQAPIEYYLDHQGDHFLIRTNQDAANFRLLRAPTADPAPANWRELIAHRADVLLADIDTFADKLVLHERNNGLRSIRICDPDGSNSHVVAFPEATYTVNAGPNEEYATDTLRFTYESPVTPPQVVDYNMLSHTWLIRKQEQIPSGYDPAAYVCERLEAAAADGAQVPISLVYRRDRPRNGPLLLIGYGAYGATMEPAFNSKHLSLLDRGMAVAIAHVRGGYDLGRHWYDQGRLLNKKNSFTDFIACAEHLFAGGYTSPQQLAISGTSAGGLLVSAVITLRRDLCRAVLARVPWTNVIAAMVKPELPLTVPEWTQWGNPAIEAEYRYMRSYDPYDNITPGPFPHIMATAGLNDLQVPYWDPAKWVARIRAAKTDDTMLILRTNMQAGHGGAAGRFSYLEEIAQEYAFILLALSKKES